MLLFAFILIIKDQYYLNQFLHHQNLNFIIIFNYHHHYHHHHHYYYHYVFYINHLLFLIHQILIHHILIHSILNLLVMIILLIHLLNLHLQDLMQFIFLTLLLLILQLDSYNHKVNHLIIPQASINFSLIQFPLIKVFNRL